ncbi:putative hinge connector long tail fiber proximal connector [Cronobacter phage vB_CsaM_SemperBestia]|uniref:Putative hinge connector long tail fiber proximal connector n=1 Tax=Cronobacter phage vB_CsaM_SemperBestia TaxID=2777353 RepID=A0A7T3TLU6_9CAUD|nr:putative hinge connector long tail fiber proximal connector [Cronobacter phage vB_CsaM_SemperBestia]
MANNEFMALFGPDSFTANVFSEANAVKYRLVVRGTNNDSAVNSVEVSINGADIINRRTQVARGINLAVIDGTTLALLDYKAFDMYGDPATNGNAIKDYLNSLPANRIVCFYTFDAIKSDDNFLATMRKIGSVAWPETRFFNIPITTTNYSHRSSYSAIYSSTMKKICMENFVGGSGTGLKDNTTSFVEVVFDEFSDIGVTGIPERMLDDPQTYSGNGYPFKAYGVWNVGSDVSRNDIFKITADIYIDQAARNAGAECYLYAFTHIASGQWISSTVLRTTGLAADTWHSVSGYYTIPDNADITRLGVSAYHYPSTVTTGQARCRNIQFCKVPREEVNRNGAAIGVNGIRMQTLSEVTDAGTVNPIEQLLSLPVSPVGVISDKKISSHNFAELDYIVSDPTEYTSTNTAEYQFKEWTATQQAAVTKASLSSYGIKPGDTIRMQCQMKRDANAIANNKGAYIVMQFWDANNTYISGINMRDVGTIPNVYSFYKNEGVIPAGAVTFDFGLYRYPNNTSTGSMSAKDVNLSIVR